MKDDNNINPEEVPKEESLNKTESFCIFCGKRDLLIKHYNKYVCKICISDILEKNDFL